MNNIILKSGKVRHIHNLRPILDHARKVGVDRVIVHECISGGQLGVHFNNTDYAVIDFCSFRVLTGWVNNPRGWARSRRSCGLSSESINIIPLKK